MCFCVCRSRRCRVWKLWWVWEVKADVHFKDPDFYLTITKDPFLLNQTTPPKTMISKTRSLSIYLYLYVVVPLCMYSLLEISMPVLSYFSRQILFFLFLKWNPICESCSIDLKGFEFACAFRFWFKEELSQELPFSTDLLLSMLSLLLWFFFFFLFVTFSPFSITFSLWLFVHFSSCPFGKFFNWSFFSPFIIL